MDFRPFYTVSLIEKKGAHYYRIDDEPTLYPGVTTILGIVSKPALVQWAANETANKIKVYLSAHAVNRHLTETEIKGLIDAAKKEHVVIKEATADLGTRAHQAINKIIMGEEVVATSDIRPCIEAFINWKTQNDVKILLGDTKVACSTDGYGGSFDAVAVIENKLTLIDFKTGNRIYPEYAYQLAAYAQAFLQTYGSRIQQAVVVRLGKTEPDFEVKYVSDLDHKVRVFRSIMHVYNDQKEACFREPEVDLSAPILKTATG